MKARFFLYEGYVDWVISPLSYILNVTDVDIATTALSEDVTHAGKFKVKVDFPVEACNPSDYDILIIPGGEPAPFDRDDRLINLIRRFDEEDKWIAAICGGPAFLAAAGVLRECNFSTSVGDDPEYAHYFNDKFMSKTDVTISENLITADGSAYIEFAVAVGKALTIFKDREDELERCCILKIN